MKYRFFILLFFQLISTGLIGQSLEDNVNIVFMKANVLYNSDRYDEAIRMYNLVLSRDEGMVQAYIMRAKAKYALGAYKGTKKDLLTFIDHAGIQKEVIWWLAKAEFKLDNHTSAMNCLKTMIEMDSYNSEPYSLAGDIFWLDEDRSQACEYWSKALHLGDTKARDKMIQYCALKEQFKQDSTEIKLDSTNIVDIQDEQNSIDSSHVVIMEDASSSALQEIEIDEDLKVQIGNGLGERKVDMVPEIFMISDQSGRLVIDICVNHEGRVIAAEIDRRKSNVNRTGIISLALRKAREFVFFPSFRDEQCGSLVYLIQ